MNYLRGRGALVGACALAGVVTSAVAQAQIYDADAPVQSAKRGVAAGTLNSSDFTALSPGVSWWYNYSATPNQTVPANSGMTFFPEVWNGDSGSLSSLSSYLAAGNRPPEILTINEPNISGQAVMTPSQAATVYANVKAIADPYGIPVSGPQMPTGGNTGVTSTSSYLSQFYTDTNNNSTTVAGIGIHIYDNFGGFTYDLSQALTNAGGRPLSVTEFANYSATSAADQLNYMIQTVDLLENTSGVNYYSWFYSRTSNPTASPYNSLLTSSAGVLTPLGQAYVNMPVHNASVYYRPNGLLQADRYTTDSGVSISATADTLAGIFADMTATTSNAQLNYNLYVAQAGLYEVQLRAAGSSGNLTLLSGSNPLNTAYDPGGNYQTIGTQIYLGAGYDSVTLRLQNAGEIVDSLNITPVPEPAMGLAVIAGGLSLAQRRRPKAWIA